MSVKHIRNREDVYVIEADSDGCRRRSLHWPKGEASYEVSRTYAFGPGVRLSYNVIESDIGLDLYGWKLGSVWLRLRSPWTKWVRIEGDYEPRHYSLRLCPFGGAILGIEWGQKDWNLTTWKIWGRTTYETETLEAGVCKVPLPEGVYHASWERKRHTTKHVRWPGTWRKPRVSVSVWIDVPGGIPVEGKGENSWDCGMDGVFGTGGDTVERAIGNLVAAVMRGRHRYGGPHDLPWPMTVMEAGNR